MKIADVGGGIVLLRVGQLRRAPVGSLLLLRNLLTKQLPHQLLEAMPVGIGADEARGRLGAIDGLRHHAEIGADRGQVETGEMIKLEALRIGENRLEIRGGIVALGREADEMLVRSEEHTSELQ